MIKSKAVLAFVFLIYGGIASHILILIQYPEIGERELKTISLGIGYDIMNAALIIFILLILLIFAKQQLQFIIYSTIVLLYLLFIALDYQYVKQFGTHLPFSTIEYLEEASNFLPTIKQTIADPMLWILLYIPATIHIIAQRLVFKSETVTRLSIKKYLLSLFSFVLIGGVAGGYSNSYVSKNLNDPLTSSALFYFYWSRAFEAEVIYDKPIEALKLVRKNLSGELILEGELKTFPLAQTNSATICKSQDEQSTIGLSLCGTVQPNILFIILESFRASDIGVYGSKIKLTPKFDALAKKGVFFKNFFANGFQTRHGFVAAYCSLMPNYGPAIMKSYKRNNFMCLPEQLKNSGYKTSWIFGSDAAFDDQLYFLPKIGFEQLIDQFSFPQGTETLGWGISDKALFDKWMGHLLILKEPFFSSSLTITNHHPFEVPEAFQIYNGDSDTHRYYEAMHYTDAMLGEFIERAEKTDWYKNSLVFIMADTANYQQPQHPYTDIEEFIRTRSQIPLLVLGGAVKNAIEVDDFFSQIDLAPTVMDLLGKPYESHWAGNSMLSKKTDPIAYTNRPGNYWAVMSLKGKYIIENDKKETFKDFVAPGLRDRYKSLGNAWIHTTKWLLQENLYWK